MRKTEKKAEATFSRSERMFFRGYKMLAFLMLGLGREIDGDPLPPVGFGFDFIAMVNPRRWYYYQYPPGYQNPYDYQNDEDDQSTDDTGDSGSFTSTNSSDFQFPSEEDFHYVHPFRDSQHCPSPENGSPYQNNHQRQQNDDPSQSRQRASEHEHEYARANQQPHNSQDSRTHHSHNYQHSQANQRPHEANQQSQNNHKSQTHHRPHSHQHFQHNYDSWYNQDPQTRRSFQNFHHSWQQEFRPRDGYVPYRSEYARFQ